MIRLLELLFGCWHKRTSFPFRARRGRRMSEAAATTGTYLVCLECGKEFAYDWQTMKVVKTRPRRQSVQQWPPPSPIIVIRPETQRDKDLAELNRLVRWK